jgi:hypothetical protein
MPLSPTKIDEREFLLRYFSAASPSFGRENIEALWLLSSMKDEAES